MSGQRHLSLMQARRVALAAQSLARGKPGKPVTQRALSRLHASLAQVQIDSINVVQRAHYLAYFARLGHYDITLLDRLVSSPRSTVTEYWGHEASYLCAELVPSLIPWQRRRWVDRSEHFTDAQHQLSDAILSYLKERPGVTAREISKVLEVPATTDREHWGWNWNETKVVTESLFARGKILSLGRNQHFERRFALAEHVIGRPLEAEESETALRRLVITSLQAQGLGTAHCIADYFRLPVQPVRQVLRSMVDEGSVVLGSVADIADAVYLLPETRIPRKIDDQLRLLSPFDPMIINRRRLAKFFGFDYRVEIYVPQAQRQYGYYVFPILRGDRFIGRVDLKADRAAGCLRVQSYHPEGKDDGTHLSLLLDELNEMARWLGLDRVEHRL
ncbi:DNA glycosylase AlkZ-like family protein [Glutamicibacter sp. PS]|uniref:winged helix-turn-helix domain-containing protein n=1 Tax=Glutamicibacter sp. PS TaxID=3075634 RepID=UPI0028444DA5|nr:crosslink repair DNA glycosylase YcaQ family protein [Glutamicibacter sp. PS]MDR4532389.1 winged helix DNA-binding domain-containing protein [Glutamicibacter sp. PS]